MTTQGISRRPRACSVRGIGRLLVAAHFPRTTRGRAGGKVLEAADVRHPRVGKSVPVVRVLAEFEGFDVTEMISVACYAGT
jgi:hypothetical protein